MARENQGLQIALIVFVMLWLVVTVVAFLFYKNWDQSKTEAAAARGIATSSGKIDSSVSRRRSGASSRSRLTSRTLEMVR